MLHKKNIETAAPLLKLSVLKFDMLTQFHHVNVHSRGKRGVNGPGGSPAVIRVVVVT